VNFQHHAEDARFITKGNHGDGLRDIHLGLDKLLRGGIDVSGVGELNITRNILLHCDAGARGANAADISRIDLNAASAKEPFHPAADRSIESASQQRIGSGVSADGLLLLRVQRLLFLGAAQGQQGNDVGLGQRGLGTKARR
jgi:hypothetical protein